jgi:hypothetical protein
VAPPGSLVLDGAPPAGRGYARPSSICVRTIRVPFGALPVRFRTEGTEAGKATEAHGETPKHRFSIARPHRPAIADCRVASGIDWLTASAALCDFIFLCVLCAKLFGYRTARANGPVGGAIPRGALWRGAVSTFNAMRAINFGIHCLIDTGGTGQSGRQHGPS